MQIKSKPMGAYQTNCYIVSTPKGELIIDPGVGATEWVEANCTNPVAILNTHGHFDHVWSNASLKDRLNIPIYCPRDDAFMLQKDPFNQGTPPSKADIEVKPNETIDIAGVDVLFRHFPGHTPGCSVIEIDNIWFSGDFLFKDSIGRWDFPYSSAKDMIKSLQRAKSIEGNYTIYPGHGPKTTFADEKRYLDYWIKQVSMSC